MNVSFTENAWEDYLYWQKMDKKIVKRMVLVNKWVDKTKRVALERKF